MFTPEKAQLNSKKQNSKILWKMAGSRNEVLRLYKQLLRESSGFSNYIFRTYCLRRVRDAFREQKNADSKEVTNLLAFGKRNLEIIKRQVIIGNLYKSPELVIESEIPAKHYEKA